MKKILACTLAMLALVSGLSAQEGNPQVAETSAITIGILQGGGGLLGVDYELLIADRLGVQVGAGLVSLGAGVTYHHENTVHSNAFWAGVWNQGVPGGSLSATYVGVSYIMRGWGWLNGQIGIAYIPFRGEQVAQNLKDLTGGDQDPPPFALLYSLGWYDGF